MESRYVDCLHPQMRGKALYRSRHLFDAIVNCIGSRGRRCAFHEIQPDSIAEAVQTRLLVCSAGIFKKSLSFMVSMGLNHANTGCCIPYRQYAIVSCGMIVSVYKRQSLFRHREVLSKTHQGWVFIDADVFSVCIDYPDSPVWII